MAKTTKKDEEQRYQILTASSTKGLEKEVNVLVAKGFEPIGPATTAPGNQRAGNPTNEVIYIQTMFKR